MAASALAAVQRVVRGPLTGTEQDAVLLTGDVTDNAQHNELAWYAALMVGERVTPRSGDGASSWVGAPGAGGWWPHFWHPDGPPVGQRPDLPTLRYGYPRVPGLTEAAREPVASPGAGLPWLTVHGNHDALLQGTVAPTDELAALATGGHRVTDLTPGQTPLVVLEGASPHGPARYTHTEASPRVAVAPDGGRALVGSTDFAGLVDRTVPADSRSGRAWAADVGELRVVALDTVNPHGGWQGSVDAAQLAWLDDELTRAAGRYVVVTSHHPSWTLTNGHVPRGRRRGTWPTTWLRCCCGTGAWSPGCPGTCTGTPRSGTRRRTTPVGCGRSPRPRWWTGPSSGAWSRWCASGGR